MKLQIEIGMLNAAFVDSPKEEIKAVIKRWTRKINNDIGIGDSWLLYDTNGNRVGYAKITDGNPPNV